MDLSHHIATIRANQRNLQNNPNFRALCALRQALMVKGMKLGTINKFMGKLRFAFSADAVNSPQFADYMAAQAEFLVTLYTQFLNEFGDDQVFIDSANGIVLEA